MVRPLLILHFYAIILIGFPAATTANALAIHLNAINNSTFRQTALMSDSPIRISSRGPRCAK